MPTRSHKGLRKLNMLATRGAVLAGVIAVALIVVTYSPSSGAAADRQAVVQARAQCPTYLLIGARGSGESHTKSRGLGVPGAELSDQLSARLDGLDEEFVPYPAVSVLSSRWRDLLNGAGAGAKIGFLGAYHDSLVVGKKWLRKRLIDVVAKCGKRTLVILTGYSQGAQIVGDVVQGQSSKALPKSVVERIAAVILFGDPYFNHDDPLAGQITDYRLATNGLLGERRPYKTLHERVLSVCIPHDPICQSGSVQFSAHTSYHRGPLIRDLTRYVVALATRFAPPEAPIDGVRVKLGSNEFQCSPWLGKLYCWGAGNLLGSIRCGADLVPIPTYVLTLAGVGQHSHTCVNNDTFYDWLPLQPGGTWRGGGFLCRRGGTERAEGEILRCFAKAGEGIVISSTGVVGRG